METATIVLLAVGGGTLAILAGVASRYRRCPEGKLLVIYGHLSDGRSSLVTDQGRFVLPLIQHSMCLSRAPIEVVHPGGKTWVRIGDTEEQWQKAAGRLLGLTEAEIVEQARNTLALGKSELATLGLVETEAPR